MIVVQRRKSVCDRIGGDLAKSGSAARPIRVEASKFATPPSRRIEGSSSCVPRRRGFASPGALRITPCSAAADARYPTTRLVHPRLHERF